MFYLALNDRDATVSGIIQECLRDTTPMVTLQNPYSPNNNDIIRLPNFKPLASGRVCQYNSKQLPLPTDETRSFNPYMGNTPGERISTNNPVEFMQCLTDCLANAECNYINYFYYNRDKSGNNDASPPKTCELLRVCGEVTHGWNPITITRPLAADNPFGEGSGMARVGQAFRKTGDPTGLNPQSALTIPPGSWYLKK